MRIFINNVDSYVGKALCADLRQVVEKDNRIIGTLEKDTDEPDMELLETMGIKRVVSRSNKKQYLEDILSCTLIVFDLHSSKLEDVEEVIKQLKLVKLERNVVFVLISSINVWAKTKNDRVPLVEEGEEEEPPEEEEDGAPPRVVKTKPMELKDSDLDRRIPSAAFESWKYLENLALSLSSRDKLRPHVVGAGILYGNGETTFNGLFEAAWLTRSSHVIIEPGDNYIPCVHVRDVSRLVRIVVQDDSVGRYLLAVDKPKKPLTQAMIVQGIVDKISKKEPVQMKPDNEVDVEFKEVMMLDLIMQPSAPMRSKQFPWWCKRGLIENLDKVAAEFCKWRNLRPIKMCMLGPPGSGSERLCQLVADRYLHEDPPLLSFDSILEEALSKCDEKGQPVKSARILKRKVAKAAKKPGGKLPLQIRTKLVREKLQSNVCRFRGYVLDGYPRSYEEAKDLFTEIELPEGEEPPPEESEEEPEEGADDEEADEPPPPPAEEGDEEAEDAPKIVLRTGISPEFVVELHSDSDKCKSRIFAGLARGASSEEEFVRLTKEYQAANLAEDGSAGTSDFFEEIAKVQVLHSSVDQNDETDTFHAIRVYLESKGQFFNYLKSEEERIRDTEVEVKDVEKAGDEDKKVAAEDVKGKEALRQADRLTEEKARMRMLAESEATLLANEAQPLRNYLMANVVPTLTEGLMEVCKVMPDDPIEYLSEYLFAHAQDIQESLAAEDGGL